MRDLTGYIRSRLTSEFYLNHKGDIENNLYYEDRNSHQLQTNKCREERRRSQRWKARMRNAILLHLEVFMSSTPTLSISHVQTFEQQCPLLKLYFEGDGCLLKD
ncbi:hypothetical protein F7725_013549 [Dissostichus mawsoni]|uniref:Uncharacterized protein n=1 Tax=Dissostichus mawsoni TaxID=36200 RepID=A0A7J5Y790_DISMA|nr:hypothetical protein F7725_013549 [Dissostichus mawsoni]